MSYEGFTECLTEKGYYFCYDAYDDDHLTGPNKDPVKWSRQVDQTNGYGEQRKTYEAGYSTYKPNDWWRDECAPKEEVGFDDVWHEDHYGNKYATKLMRYKPADEKHWHLNPLFVEK